MKDEGHSEELLRRALIDESDAAAVALRVAPLSLCDALTVSRPPTCSGASVALPGFDHERFKRRSDVETVGGAAWTQHT